MIRSLICHSLIFAAVLSLCPGSSAAQTVNGQWRGHGFLSGNVALVNKNKCNFRLAITFPPAGSQNVMYLSATRIVHMGGMTPAQQTLEFDFSRDDLNLLGIGGVISQADYNKISGLYEDPYTTPFSLMIGTTLIAGTVPQTFLVYANRDAQTSGYYIPVTNPSLMRIEKQCWE